MKVVLRFTYDADIIDVPEYVAVDLKSYQLKFDKWLFNKKNEHGYWRYDSKGKKSAVAYRGDAFVHWLNTFLPEDEKATFLESETSEYDKNLPKIYF